MTEEQRLIYEEWVRRQTHQGLIPWLKTFSGPQWDWDVPHIKLFAEKLESMPPNGDMYFNLPIRHSKTATGTERFPVWLLTRSPGLRICIAGHTTEFAQHLGQKALRVAMESGLDLDEKHQTKSEWYTKQGGSVSLFGAGQAVIGRGFDWIIVDDPIKSREEAESDIVMEQKWDWFSQDLFSRREPGCRMVLTMSRWNEKDIAQRCLDLGWNMLHLPALSLGSDVDPLGREENEALWPERFPRERLEEMRLVMGDYAFQAQLQGMPVSKDGALFMPDKIQFGNGPNQSPETLWRGWDLAATKDSGDWTATVLLSGPDEYGRIWVHDAQRVRMEPAERNRWIVSVVSEDARVWGDRVVQVIPQDPGSAGKESYASLVSLLRGNRVRKDRPTGSKEVRAEPFASQVNAGNVRKLPKIPDSYTKELRSFPRGAHDDFVDASSSAFQAAIGRKKQEVQSDIIVPGTRKWLDSMRSQPLQFG